MAINFNIDEIFEIAEQIERNGAEFYREAAKKAPDQAMQKMFTDLALMEDGHLKIFHDMRKKLGPEDKEQEAFDPDSEAALYLQAMADNHGTEGRINLKTKLTGKESTKDVLKIAVDAERNSIVFYTILKGLVSDRKDSVEEIITEEIGHLAVLKMYLAKLP